MDAGLSTPHVSAQPSPTRSRAARRAAAQRAECAATAALNVLGQKWVLLDLRRIVLLNLAESFLHLFLEVRVLFAKLLAELGEFANAVAHRALDAGVRDPALLRNRVSAAVHALDTAVPTVTAVVAAALSA